MEKIKIKRNVLWALKIAVGCSLAIWLAHFLELEHSTLAGSIALLTLVSTKWGTVKLSLYRLITFVISVALALLCFNIITSDWIAFGIYIFFIVLICEMLGWRSTISVNALIGIHFLLYQDFSMAFIRNEFLLVVIGIVLAFLLNLFHDNQNHKYMLEKSMRYSEEQMQIILQKTASYLMGEKLESSVWKDVDALMEKVEIFKQEAHEYQDNTFHSHPEYYISYFEMRLEQCIIFKNLHDNLKKLRSIPTQAKTIAGYMLYLREYVIEIHVPDKQLEQLHYIFACMREEELPATREEFENRALLYHVLMDLEDFLMAKTRFVNGMNAVQKQTYWGK